MNKEEKAGVFLNGKAQIIEMLKYMGANEKEVLMKNVKARNPQLASELLEKSFTFQELINVDSRSLKQLFQNTKSAIWGLALQNTDPEFQRKILSIAPRAYAEEAFSIMTTSIGSKRIDSGRAQNKILQTYVKMKQRLEYNSSL